MAVLVVLKTSKANKAEIKFEKFDIPELFLSILNKCRR